MITVSDPTENVEIGDIVVNKYNRFSRGYDLKFRISGFIKINQMTLVNAYRVKYVRREKEWVSFGREQTLIQCYKFSEDDYHYMK